MRASKNKLGLYEFDIEVRGQKKTKKLKGLIDTGSTDCACTYQVITTLQIRPVDFALVSSINILNQSGPSKRSLIYSVGLGFDGKGIQVPLIRVANLPDGIHFILGMSALNNCNLNFTNDYLDISWK
jgi:hypothetical protein